MTKARDLANAGTALTSVSATELGYVDGVTSAIQTQIDSKEPTLPSQTGNSGKYLTTNGSTKSWGTVSQYSLPSQTGNSGKFLTTNGTSESWGTVPGINFTFRASISNGTDSINHIEYNGSNLYVAVGGGGTASVLATSPDGVTWTTRTSGFGTDAINRVAYGNGLWVAVGDNGKISTSSDGITWTARTSNMGTNQIQDVKYANGVWVAVGAGGGTTNTGGITYSTDGITWTRKSQTLTVGALYYSVVWNGTNWVIGAGISTNNYLYASTPSGTWTAGTDGSGAGIIFIAWDGTRHIMILNNGTARFSTSTTIGTATTLTGISAQNGTPQKTTAYYNGNIHLLGNAHVIIHSTTPQTGNISSKTNPYIPPSTRINSSGNTTSDGSTIAVFAAGTIIGGNNGEIWTSF